MNKNKLFFQLTEKNMDKLLEFPFLDISYDDDIYISFSCRKEYTEKIKKELKYIFGYDFIEDESDYYADFLIGLKDIEKKYISSTYEKI